MKKNDDVSVIGPGAVGSSLVAALVSSGYTIASVYSRSAPSGLNRLQVPHVECLPMAEIDEKNLGRLVFLTTPDDAIFGVAELLAGKDINWKGRVVAHCSGLCSSDHLSALARKGARTASFHPIQTFARQYAPGSFRNITISLEGDPEAVAMLKKLVGTLGSQPLPLNRKQKGMLHVAAVFLSNYLVVLGGFTDSLIRSSIPGADTKVLAPLLLKTASNLAGNPPAEVLTGPVARGDSATVRQHLKMLGDHGDGEVLHAYKILGRQALMLAGEKGALDGPAEEELRRLFGDRQYGSVKGRTGETK